VVCQWSSRLEDVSLTRLLIHKRKKYEIATDEEFTPIKQDTKKGELREFKKGDIYFNYGWYVAGNSGGRSLVLRFFIFVHVHIFSLVSFLRFQTACHKPGRTLLSFIRTPKDAKVTMTQWTLSKSAPKSSPPV
jgi:hypothetical protein